MANYEALLEQKLFDNSNDHMVYADPDQIRITYERARAICRESGMTVEDCVELRPKFWDFHRNFITTVDTATATILTIHWNLAMGTIGAHASHRPDLLPILEQLKNFDAVGEYILTEIDHGLDARNIETTATLQSDGSYDLHTPHPRAAKVMPPSTPWAGIPRIAIVFARLKIDGSDRGVKPFIVKLSEATQLCQGVASRLLPKRSGARAIDHAITTFNHVRLNADALLGPPSLGQSRRRDFLQQISRLPVGGLALSLTYIPLLKKSAFIAGTWSIQRTVTTKDDGQQTSVINFSTQHRPVLLGLVQAEVFDTFADYAIDILRTQSFSDDIRHGVAVCFKATVHPEGQRTVNELADRLGWNGVFSFNRVIELAQFSRGNGIAEGEILVICIKLVSEVLLGRYELPGPTMPDSPLARHEYGVWQEARHMASSFTNSAHRGKDFNTHILPRCRKMIEATGHRMAYEAAVASGRVEPEALALFESHCIMSDPSWYCEYDGKTRQQLFSSDAEITQALLPQLSIMLGRTKARPWTNVPILSKQSWETFVHKLPSFSAPHGPHAKI
ncbi:hypothetical protein BFJ72_g11268 [Fusarium proliferatum]|uniref:Acyl-CoA oxidase n=1 Tax=Gibberella intermedia TaxID=948311 RepID=A0A420SN56_GIBIN|nr:hypothetical protein BFJ72_g11268 [Fusarium proliferatum]